VLGAFVEDIQGYYAFLTLISLSYPLWYIVIDPVSGAAGYMISGGLAGSYTGNPVKDPNFKNTWVDKLLFDVARNHIAAFAVSQIGTRCKQEILQD